MSNNDISQELGVVQAVARLRLAEVVLGLVAYGLDRKQAATTLEGAVRQALDEVYGEEPRQPVQSALMRFRRLFVSFCT